MNPALEGALINLGCGLVLLIAWPWFRRGKRALALRAKIRAEAVREATARAAAGIKGDGFAALFHLHRAMHCRIRAVSFQIFGTALYLVAVIVSGPNWWMGIPFQLAALVLFFKGAKAAGLADAMTDVAMEAATQQENGGKEKADEAVLPEPAED